MRELLDIQLLPVLLTLLAYQAGLKLQQKIKSPLINPILVGVLLVLPAITVLGISNQEYQSANVRLSWLMTPATICLAIPMYEQFQVLKRNWKALAAGIAAGALSCLVFLGVFCLILGYERSLTVSVLPKSITSAIGVPLSELSGGISSVTTAVIIFTGIFANVSCPFLVRLFRLTDEIAIGAALGTSGHVIGTARANELSPLAGAVSSLSLVVAGLLTAALFPLITGLL